MPTITESSADRAYPIFKQLVEAAELMGVDDPDRSETDTRSKLVDPLFRDVLGWTENDIRREEPVADGFADYSFGYEFKWFHVEAKRSAPRFKLAVTSRARKLKLSGPHLLGNKEVKPLLEQVVKYSPELGTQFGVLTNGSQFILFETTPRKKSWKDGDALVWHDHTDILGDFAEFHAIFARENVEAGSLIEHFARITSITIRSHTPLQYIHNPESELEAIRELVQAASLYLNGA